ncbi:ParB/RepB/Spo0J family partition protein [Pedomonas mirosovicensis]|uniref:ParB/RepB/Spo0J family partition protein n=1 Tax=Pedomonas mirosovicensis TaxID=2908641 RepID=UPI002166DC46|nr:ParB/RepB/Spo0J family partition protein [Pedomonas mirosovicensis]MCH8686429.1 ParB/RepB/Spo0J family partition protein [Pedomonas mirosovicensis]
MAIKAKSIISQALEKRQANTPEPGAGENANLSTRMSALGSALGSDTKVQTQRLIDPSRCRIWQGNARIYDQLTLAQCQDLIDNLIAEGGQKIPAVVRPVRGDASVDYEVICGARRHWSISWLRAHNYPEMKFLVAVQDMDDEAAFRLQDLENRERQDISDYERARSYAQALDYYYGGQQHAMAKRLNVSESWLSRYLTIARLPEEVLAAFGDKRALNITAAAEIAPLLKTEKGRSAVLAAANELAAEQETLAGEGRPFLPAATVRTRLKKSAATPKASKTGPETVTLPNGRPVLRFTRPGRGGAFQIQVLPGHGASKDEVLALISQTAEQLLR